MRILSLFVNMISVIINIFLFIVISFSILHFVGLPLMRLINQASLLQPLIILLCLIIAVAVHYAVYCKLILPFRRNLRD